MTDLKKFTELHIKTELKNALTKADLLYMKPVQIKTIPHILSQKDVIVQSQTGSGKTLAFLIPILNAIDPNSKVIQSLIIVPTRELCFQIKDVASSLGCEAEAFVGGLPIEKDLPRLNTTICIATPGRISEILTLEPKKFHKVRYLVLDECDKLLSQGFESSLLKILLLLPKQRITGLFSATINEGVDRLSLHSLRNPVKVVISEEMPENLLLKYAIVKSEDKLDALVNLTLDKKSIVFFATCAEVEFFYHLFLKTYCSKERYEEEIVKVKIEPKKVKGKRPDKEALSLDTVMQQSRLAEGGDEKVMKNVASENIDKNFKIQRIHGKMEQLERNKIYEKFQEDGGLLFCTDVAARGIDFKEINLVVHFDIPKEYTNIVHRSGRTARNGMSGESVLFVMPNEKAYIDYLNLKKITMETMEIPSKVLNLYDKIDGKSSDPKNCDSNFNSGTTNTQVNDERIKEELNIENKSKSSASRNMKTVEGVKSRENIIANPEIKREKLNEGDKKTTEISPQYVCDQSVYNIMKDQMDPMLLKLSVVAFVSFIRSYKEHIVNYILSYKELDYDGLADLFFLIQPPGMQELQKVKFKKFQKEEKRFKCED